MLEGWTDEFTPVGALSQKARNHKYGVFTAALANLRPGLRNYSDFILLLCIYNSRYLKSRGGMSRIMTRIGACGTTFKTPVMSFADELKLGDAESPFIWLPNDDDPTSPPLRYRLRVFLLFVRVSRPLTRAPRSAHPATALC